MTVMGQPTPPGDNVPLYEGLDSSWNDIVGAFPEDQRAVLAPKLKERLAEYEPLKQWEDLQKSGITPAHASQALDVFTIIENNPRQVYDTIAKHLGISTQEAKEVVEEIQDADPEDDPRIATMQKQLDALTQIALMQRQQTTEQERASEVEAQIDKELSDLKKKYSDVDEEQIILRMVHKDMTAEEAYKDFSSWAAGFRKKPVSPMILGGGGSVPRKEIDVTKLDPGSTKNLVAQMIQHANDQARS